MNTKLTTPIIAAILLFGCQTAPLKTVAIQPDMNNKFENTQHKVWKEVSYKGIKNNLKEGEVIIFKNVEIISRPNGSFYYLGDIYSIDNQKLFDEKYTLSDIGVINSKRYIDKTVNSAAVMATRGIQYHGISISKNGFSDTYWKTMGGESPKAIPVRDFRSNSPGKNKVAETFNNGLYLHCVDGQVHMEFSSDDFFAAKGESTTVTVYYPYSKGKEYPTETLGYKSVWLTIDNYIERILIEEDAINLVAYSHDNHKFINNTSYNNGLSEAYTRIKRNCSR